MEAFKHLAKLTRVIYLITRSDRQNAQRAPEPDYEDMRGQLSELADEIAMMRGAVNLPQLPHLLDRHFNANELRTLCFDLEVDYDNLPGKVKAEKARALVTYFVQPERDIAQLVRACAEQRPKAAWYLPGAAGMKSPSASGPGKLRRMLTEHLGESQIRALCTSLEVDYQLLPGADAEDKAGGLVSHMARSGRTAELVAACMGLRPDIPWEQALRVARDEPPTETVSKTPREVDRIELRRALVAHFNVVQLRDLCFELGEDYDDLPGREKASKARELIRFLERRGRLAELAEVCARQRPDLDW